MPFKPFEPFINNKSGYAKYQFLQPIPAASSLSMAIGCDDQHRL